MTKICPLVRVDRAIVCDSSCAWFSEDVDACAIWKIAEGFNALAAMITDIVERANKTIEEALQKQENKEDIQENL